MKQICVLGDGAWGTAVAMLLADNGFSVKLWCHNKSVADDIKTSGCNTQFLPGVKLHKSIIPVTDIEHAIGDSEYIFEAIPVAFLRSVITQAAQCCKKEQIWVVLSKGIEQNTLLLPGQILDDVCGHEVKKAVLSGPSFARDVINKQVTAVTLAATDCEVGKSLQKMLANDYFRPSISLDVLGVQIGGALKNGIALAVGMLDGAGYTDNVKAFLFTRGLHEMIELTVALGGKQETLYGFSGVGDLVLTAMGRLSKNVACGKRLGSGEKLSDIKKGIHTLPEGINTIASVHQLMNQRNLFLPVYSALYEILFQEKPIAHLLKALITHPLEYECELEQRT